MAIMGFSSLSVLFLCAYFDDRFSFAAIGAGIIILLLTLFIRKFRERVTPFFVAAALIFSGVSFEVLSRSLNIPSITTRSKPNPLTVRISALSCGYPPRNTSMQNRMIK